MSEARLADRDLTPVLKAQPGVCRVCRQWSPGYLSCFPCHDFTTRLRIPSKPILPIALAVKREPLATALWQYKDGFGEEADLAASRLRHLVEDFMPRHEACLAESLGVLGFDCIAPVPSSRRRSGVHPLRSLIDDTAWARGRVLDLLEPDNRMVPAHEAAEDKFTADSRASGQRVLLFDDTWTRGANALSAVAALRRAGAKAVGIAVIGRHFDPTYRSSAVYSDEAESLGFRMDACAACDPRPRANPPLLQRVDDLDRAAPDPATPPDPWARHGGSPF
jgi:hypothetical protein